MEHKVKPITPDQVMHEIPDEIIENVNKLILEKWNGREAYVLQEDIVQKIVVNTDYSRNEIFEKNYLDFEHLYRNAGWKVTYEKPFPGDNFKAYFLFEK